MPAESDGWCSTAWLASLAAIVRQQVDCQHDTTAGKAAGIVTAAAIAQVPTVPALTERFCLRLDRRAKSQPVHQDNKGNQH
jgi:hypothetical protein